MHLHLRDGSILKRVIRYTSKNFARAIVMPNLVPPITTSAMARCYKERILRSVPANHNFKPLMTLYLTEFTQKEDLIQGFKEGVISAVKLYPAGATTNSSSGVNNIEKVFPIFETMTNLKLPVSYTHLTLPTICSV